MKNNWNLNLPQRIINNICFKLGFNPKYAPTFINRFGKKVRR